MNETSVSLDKLKQDVQTFLDGQKEPFDESTFEDLLQRLQQIVADKNNLEAVRSWLQSYSNQLYEVWWLLQNVADFHKEHYGWTLPHLALSIDKVERLLAFYANDPVSSLMELAELDAFTQREFIKTLVDFGLDVSIFEQIDWVTLNDDNILHGTPMTGLMKLTYNQQPEVVIELIKSGASINDYTTKGTVLSVAVEQAMSLEFVKQLIELGADVDAPNSQGDTPLHIAIKNNQFELAQLLSEHGAAHGVKNLDGLYPYQLSSNPQASEFLDVERFPQIINEVEGLARRLNVAENFSAIACDVASAIVFGQKSDISAKPKAELEYHCISNNQGYFDSKRNNVIDGAAMSVTYEGEEYPLGYNIYIPDDASNIDRIVISVYGGGLEHKPHDFNRFGLGILKDGDMFVELNLPDLILLGDKGNQFDMDDTTQSAIHCAIDRFYQVMTHDPSIIHAELKKMLASDRQMYLTGQSFGGRTAVRHGQLYPGTFNGYISINGALTQLKDTTYAEHNDRLFSHAESLLPVFHLEKTQEPVLVLQNADDNNVVLVNAIEFYEKALDSGKQDLVRLSVFKRGSEISQIPEEIRSSALKGHSLPNGQELARLMDTVHSFMRQETKPISELHQFRAVRNKHIIDRFYYGRSDEERFLCFADNVLDEHPEHSRMLRLYHQGDVEAWDRLWATEYQDKVAVFAEAGMLANDSGYLNEYLNFLKEQDAITDEIVRDYIISVGPSFIEYYNETHEGFNLTMKDLVDNPQVVYYAKVNLKLLHLNESSSYKCYTLEHLLLPHPELLPPLSMSQAWTRESLAQAQNSYKSSFEARRLERSRAVTKTWLSLYDRVANKNLFEQKTGTKPENLENSKVDTKDNKTTNKNANKS